MKINKAKKQLIIITILFFGIFGMAKSSLADTHTAASCSFANVQTAYNAASDGDIISVPAGDCSSLNSWSSTLLIQKEITIQGAGIDQTIIGASADGDRPFQIRANNVRITGFTLDSKNKNLSNQGMIMVGDNSGSLGCSSSMIASDFRIDNNKFINDYPSPLTDVLGWPAITTRGFVYGLIDNNTFENCYGECLDIASNGTAGNPLHPASWERSLEFGQYTNGTVYIEDNTWTYDISGGVIDNIVDGNDGSRYVFRYNTVTIGANINMAGMLSGHELYYAGDVCDSASNGGVGSLLMEAYENKVYINDSNGLDMFVHQRSGRSLIYNNTIYNNDTNESALVRLTNRRSQHDLGDIANPRGYSGYCHEVQASYTSEGISFNKTSLNGALGNDNGCPTMASAIGFPSYGGSIIIGTEQIDYTGISDNTLTPCTRGANYTTRATHNNGAVVDLLIFGQCLEQPNNTWIWGNKTVGNADKNNVWVRGYDLYGYDPQSKDYTFYDIKSYTDRPQNWQFRNDGTAYLYTPYTYPHPLQGPVDETSPAAPHGLSVS